MWRGEPVTSLVPIGSLEQFWIVLEKVIVKLFMRLQCRAEVGGPLISELTLTCVLSLTPTVQNAGIQMKLNLKCPLGTPPLDPSPYRDRDAVRTLSRYTQNMNRRHSEKKLSALLQTCMSVLHP